MQQKILTLISDNPEVFESSFLLRFPTDEELTNAEIQLGFNIPNEYIWFLKTYGHGGFFFEFLGYGLNDTAIFVDETLHERKFGLPTNLLVIEDCDEYVVCIDTINNKVVSWSKHDKDGVISVAESFYDYFLNRIKNAIDNY